ncbi:nitronate monooxygenase [Myxococcaceae bacterium GXIMD 01537]
MWTDPRLCASLSVEHPLFLAPMAGGPSTPALAAAVSEAGAVGSLGAAYLTPEALRQAVRDTRALTSRPFGVNLFSPLPAPPLEAARLADADRLLSPYRAELGLPPRAAPPGPGPDFAAQLQVVLEERPALLSFTFGRLPADALRALKAAGIRVAGTATTVAEGLQLEADGVDFIVAQGGEAGGHRGTFLAPFEDALVGTLVLVPQLCDAVRVPVVASGGIMDGRGIVACLALGAAGVQLGTAFLACEESGTPEVHKRALATTPAEGTTLTRAFSGRPARGLRNRMAEELAPHAGELPPYPWLNSLTRDVRTAAAKAGRPEFLSMWAGQGAAMAQRKPAGQLVRELLEDTARRLAALCPPR